MLLYKKLLLMTFSTTLVHFWQWFNMCSITDIYLDCPWPLCNMLQWQC